jgi:predicted ATPase
MQRFILTGAPGAGKTVIVRQLERWGVAVVEEAATDHIALEMARGVTEPHLDPGFTEAIAALQRARRLRAAAAGDAVQVHDRSAVCTLALARQLGHPIGPVLAGELDEITREAAFERRVFFVELMGFVTPTAARRIDLAGALAFERIHAETYRELGYHLIRIKPGAPAERARAVVDAAGGLGTVDAARGWADIL